MYSDKKNILQLVALLIEHNIKKIVLCPGSRNSPIVHTIANHPFFSCYPVTDERSARSDWHYMAVVRLLSAAHRAVHYLIFILPYRKPSISKCHWS